MRLLACLPAVLSLLVTTALSNTEKTIFIAPPPIQLPAGGPSLQALALDTISPANSSLRTSLPVAFPTESQPRGIDHWYLLQGLSDGQRYEVRVCWAATAQPTEFWLNTHTITHVFDTPSLIQSLSSYSDHLHSFRERHVPQPLDSTSTILFLHVQSAADYFTTNKTLMRYPPSVDVDIILDPYLANVFPQSLLPTALYLVVLALGAWFISGAIWNFVQSSGVRSKQHAE